MTPDEKSVFRWNLASLLVATLVAAAAVYLWGFR
jgi:hypothetical protein